MAKPKDNENVTPDDDENQANPGSDAPENTEGQSTEGAEGASQGDGDTTGADGDGSEGGQSEGDEAPRPLTGQEILKLFQDSPDAQAIVQRQAQGWFQEAQTNAAAQQRDKEFQTLVAEERWDEIGKQFVEEKQRETVRAEAEEAALRQAFAPIYGKLLSHPAMASLTAEEKDRLNPQKFADDHSFILELTRFIASKEGLASLEGVVDKQVKDKIDAVKNMKSGANVNSNSASGLPGATGPSDAPKSSSDLLRGGWEEALAATQADKFE